MSKEKQIEELTNELVFTSNYGTYNAVANYLVNKGYRKQSEGEGLVLTFDGATGYFPKEFIIEAIRAYSKQKKGSWKVIKPTRENGEPSYICSVCGALYHEDVREWKGCPKCLSEMKGE